MLFQLIFSLFCGLNLVNGDIISQPLSISGNILTTQLGVGTPPQYFDLGIFLSTDKSVLVDSAAQNPDLDFYYDYIKQTFSPEVSDTLNITNQICRIKYKDSNNYFYTSDGHQINDYIVLGGLIFKTGVRFCDLDTPRNATSTYNDPLNWLMSLPLDGILGLKPGGENIFEKVGAELNQITFFANSSPIEADNAGIVTFGGQDTKNCKSFRTFPSEDSDSWTIWITKATFNSKSTSGTYSTLLDWSASNLIVPTEVLNLITQYFGGATNFIYCSSYSSIPNLKLNVYGSEYEIPIKPYFQRMSSESDYCQLNIDTSSSSDENQIVLGRNILDKYCLFLDYDKSEIGLADIKSS